MYKPTTIVDLLDRVRRRPQLAVCAVAGLLLVFTMSAVAQAQVANTYTGATVVHGGIIGLAPGQKVSVVVPNFCYGDGSVKFLKHTIKVYARSIENESILVYSGESGGLNELAHKFTLAHGDIPAAGEPQTGRVEIFIIVESFPPNGGVKNVEVVSPLLQLIDGSTDKTVAIALLLPAVQVVR
jgi:hypothetical protein